MPQFAAAIDEYAALPWVRRVCIDATGIGMQLAEERKLKHGAKVEPVMFTNPVKADLAVTLHRAMEDRAVRIPYNQQLAADLRTAADNAADAEADALINSEAAQAGVELTEEEKKEVKDEIVSNRKHGLRFLEVLCNSKKKPAAETTATPRPLLPAPRHPLHRSRLHGHPQGHRSFRPGAGARCSPPGYRRAGGSSNVRASLPGSACTRSGGSSRIGCRTGLLQPLRLRMQAEGFSLPPLPQK